jgi:hypothetical protein
MPISKLFLFFDLDRVAAASVLRRIPPFTEEMGKSLRIPSVKRRV